ncbi:MAG: hypothetical protein IPO21_20790 [Bacteroidales bacterium]|nr:hypothetical protein [Bacteroidales bacterium]
MYFCAFLNIVTKILFKLLIYFINKYFFIVALILFSGFGLYAQDSVNQVKDTSLYKSVTDSISSKNAVDSLLPSPKSSAAKPIESPVEYIAEDSIVFNVNAKNIFVYGNGDIKYEDIVLLSEYIKLAMTVREVFATGLVTV